MESELHKSYDFTNSMITNMTRAIVSKKDHVILSQIKKLGYDFENDQDLIKFIKKRCKIEVYQDRTERYFVDNTPIVEF